jgi:hypothetical protein
MVTGGDFHTLIPRLSLRLFFSLGTEGPGLGSRFLRCVGYSSLTECCVLLALCVLLSYGSHIIGCLKQWRGTGDVAQAIEHLLASMKP